ncbi:LytR/AlgR family response regulator transcription factor [Magnetofaba australis]|nr:response regulator [Magnetofaba australis]
MSAQTLAEFRALWVDDDDVTLELMAALLNRLEVGHVATVNQAAKAVDLLIRAAPPYDVAFCDIYMPDMDGMELIQELGKHRYTGALIFVTSAKPEMFDLLHAFADAYDLNLRAVLNKPVSIDRLREILHTLAEWSSQ